MLTFKKLREAKEVKFTKEDLNELRNKLPTGYYVTPRSYKDGKLMETDSLDGSADVFIRSTKDASGNNSIRITTTGWNVSNSNKGKSKTVDAKNVADVVKAVKELIPR